MRNAEKSAGRGSARFLVSQIVFGISAHWPQHPRAARMSTPSTPGSAWLVRYAPRLATGARGPSAEGMLTMPAGSDCMFLHTHPDGKRLASAPRVIGMHIAMRFNVEQYQCEALFVAPSGEGNPAYDTAFPGTGGEPAVPEAPAEVSWDETLYKFEETLAGWLGLADEDPSRRTAEARYLAPDIIPDEYPELPHGVRFENEDSDGESSSSSTVSSSSADTRRNATDASSSANARRAMTDELERLRARFAFLEAKEEGKEDAFRSQFGKTAGMGTEIGSAAQTMRANVSAAQRRQTRPRLIVPRPMCAR